MPQYLIRWSYGFAGADEYDQVEADSLKEAQEMAWEQAIQSVDSSAEPLTKELAEEHNLEWENNHA